MCFMFTLKCIELIKARDTRIKMYTSKQRGSLYHLYTHSIYVYIEYTCVKYINMLYMIYTYVVCIWRTTSSKYTGL